MARRIRRWDLFWVNLGPTVGSEQGGARRPALVVSNDGFNRHFSVVTVLPLTGTQGKRRRVYPFEIGIRRGAAGNPEDSIVMPQQIRTVSKTRLQDRIGALSDRGLRAEIENRLLEHLGIEIEFAPSETEP